MPALALAACGGDDEGGSSDSGGSGGGGASTVNVYSSLPLQGASQDQTKAMVQGIELALEEAQNKAGDITVKYESLDDSTAQAGTWTPEAVQANAGKVARDKNAAFYIGEFNSGASALSIPVLNEAGIPQLSPANTAVGLTTNEPGADKGEPDKYYPAGTRTYARIVPKDTIQGAALATTMKEDGCTNVAMANDKEVYGAGLARNIESAAKEQGLKVLRQRGHRHQGPELPVARPALQGPERGLLRVRRHHRHGSVQIFKDMASALPDAKLYGPDAWPSPVSSIRRRAASRSRSAIASRSTVATLSPDEYPPEGQEFFELFEEKYNAKNPDPYADLSATRR
jgi:branched-chain amino acid transport system substrate-binding protein